MKCRHVRPLLFAYDEGGLDPQELELVEAHVADCVVCRRELESERRLTALLTRRRSPRRGIPLSAAGIVAAAVLAALVLQSPEAYGSILPQTLTPQMTLTDGETRPLTESNHVEVATVAACTIRIDGVGVLKAQGPAVFELDRAGGRWKLTLLRGEVHAEIEEGAGMIAVSLLGERRLEAGPHWIALQEDGRRPSAKGPTAEELMALGHRAFFTDEDFPAAERHYRAAVDHPGVTAAQKARAHFYLGASLGRQERYAEAVEVQEAWLRAYPEDDSRHYVLLFQGIYHDKLGNERAAIRAWQTIVDEAPESPLAEHARRYLGAGSGEEKAPAKPKEARALLPAGKAGGYVVVDVALTDKRFRAVAGEIAAFHEAQVIEFDNRDFDGLARRLRDLSPENVLFVVQPEVLDVNLHRRIVMLSARLDEDIFPDFSFGYFTARDGAALGKLWERTQALRKQGVSARRWLSTSVASTIRCTKYAGSVPAIARAAGFSGDQYYWGSVETDPDNLAFVRRSLPALNGAGVITMTGCGDPQGTWLFSDRRNIDGSRHWEYDATKVGQDPDGEMPRITAAFLKPLELAHPICWSGVCHTGATERVFVEGDIVSTFGRTSRATLYRLKPGESFCLALIDAGAAAYFCPIAANHGMSVSREVDFALLHGATLGETMKSTYDDIWLAAGGELVLGIQEDGELERHPEYVMQGGGANRILLGDPSLRPFRPTPHPQETVEITRTGNGFDVVVTWTKGFHAWGWDMFGEDRARDWCTRARVDLDGLVPVDKRVRFAATVAGFDEAGKEIAQVLAHAEPEAYHGRRYLHLQANAPRGEVSYKYRRVVFRVAVRP